MTMEKRESERFDKVFPVWVESAEFGECGGIARNISSGGMFIEMAEPLPLGTRIRVHFAVPDAQGAMIACGEVKRHYFLQFSDATGPRMLTGVGIRFTAFEDDGQDQLAAGLDVWKSRVLH